MPQTRQLAAIMFTDIVGYTTLMGTDEHRAFSILNENRLIQKPIIEKNGGRWIKEIGDAVLASFNTVSDSVNAAIRIQEACNATNEYQLRIGIHLGEVVFENNDVFGDGVNIASRIQSIARPGTIFVSETVHQNIFNKKSFQTRFKKEEKLKNVIEPIKIYEVIFTSDSHSSIDEKEVITQNSIAVLPFINMSSDPEQEYFSDGITEEIITDLSHVQDLLVISRSSVTAFKNTNKNVKEIARELNVHYLLQGSVRKAGDNLRITTQLIDARRDANVWAEKYSGTLDDVFDIQEKVSRSIVEALKLKLTRAEDKQISDRPIADINAYDHYLRARRELHKWNPEAFDNARKHIERAMEIVGPNAVLYGAMGYLYWNYANLGIEPELNYEKAQEFANKSFLIDHDSPSAHLIKANINIMYLGNPIEGVKHLDKILHTNPHDFDAMMWKGIIYMMWGKKDECELIGSKMYQLDPLNAVCHALRGGVDFYTGNFDTAIAPMLRAHEIEPENSIFQMFIPFCYAYNQEFPQAISFIENKMNPDTKGFILEAGLMLKSALLKQQDKVIDWIAEIPKNVHKDPQYSHFVGSLCAFAGLNDEAIHWLENAINSGFYNYPFLAEHEFAYKHLRNDPRYLELLQEAKREWKKIPLQE